MTSYNRITVNTAHLIPAAAVWQGPKFITALTSAALKGSVILFAVWAIGIVMAQTPVFNAHARERQNQYELCLGKFKLQGSYTSKEFTEASGQCWAQAQLQYLQNKTR